LTLLKNGNFLRFFLAQFVSSLGDWIGVIAIAVFAERLGGNTGVGAVMTARVLPGFLVGPVAGVIADRWDRKRTMMVADATRAALIFSLPFVENLLYLLVVSALLESLTLVWGPSKDASLPHFVPRKHLQHANSMSLLGVYVPWPLASIVFASLVPVARVLGESVPVMRGLVQSPEALALWLDSITFAFSATMISTLAIPASRARGGRLDMAQAKRDLVEGLTFVRDDRKVRPWLLGIAFTFTAAGGVFSLGVAFTQEILNGGQSGFAFLIGFLGTGMIVGLLASGILAKKIAKDVLFSACLYLLGASLVALATMSSLNGAIPIASALGFFGGAGYSTAYSLMQESTSDELRGRTFSAAYTIIRIGTLVGLGLFPFLADAIGDYQIGSYPVSGTRITLWTAGLVVIGGGVISMRAINAGRAASVPQGPVPYFVVFEGGEGAGKSTQMDAFVEWLKARGDDVVTTREPGGTALGARIRDILLDPGSEAMDPRAEALLYAADRAQHVAEVIRPALDGGKIVVSDRFVDSSLAYQGLARGLGLDEIYEISRWAIDGTLPDLVLWLKLDAESGLRRLSGDRDRIEGLDGDFHARVADGYMALAEKFPDRFVVLDGTKEPAELHKDVVAAFQERCGPCRESVKPEDLPSSGTPVPR
jgi:dTMP kinase